MECFNCGATEEEGAKMHKVISDTEIVKVCDKCIKQVNLPKIKKLTEIELEKSEKMEKQGDWRNRVNKQIEDRQSFKIASTHGLTLRDVVERKMNPSLAEKTKPKPDLIHNFHWEILKARRQRNLTQMKLGTAIGESEMSIRMIERGVVPTDYHPVIQRLENVLKIKLFTDEYRKMNQPIEEELTVGDIKEAQPEVSEPYWRRFMSKLFSKKVKKEETSEEKKDEESSEVSEDNEFDEAIESNEEAPKEVKNNSAKEAIKKKELSPEEINKMIFGAKKK